MTQCDCTEDKSCKKHRHSDLKWMLFCFGLCSLAGILAFLWGLWAIQQ